MAKATVPPWGTKFADALSWRAWMTDHLLHHPDHRRQFPSGHDFVLVSTIDIARRHQALHVVAAPYTGTLHEHDRPWRVTKKEESVSERLDLKVTVEGPDPDTTLVRMDKEALRLASNVYSLKVIKVERADGRSFGLESAFEAYWRGEVGSKPGDEQSDEKLYARQAFLYAARKYGKEGK